MNNPLKEFRPESLCLLKETQEDYWCYARKGPQDFSVYTEKSSIYETPRKEKFRESAEVLVRWTDGLFYLATIIQVEEEYNRCAVKFEDGSQFWALFKDIYKGSSHDNDFSCTICDSSSSHPPDEIVICDKCSLGYHQLCHIPKIEAADLNPDLPWSCRKCVFANAIKKGGAVKKGSNAQMMLLMKQTLPYDLQALTWDSTHKSNLQQTYCYCGGPGEWHSKMLQCTRCRQWFHEACLQCLDEPLLFGDRFYIFVCSVCNKGPEFLRRLPIKWPDIAHLVLFNLSIIHGKKYFEFDTSVMNFLKDNWSQFQIKGESLSRITAEDTKKKLLEHLQNCKSRFTSGKDIKKKTILWGLRSRMPPSVPSIPLPEMGVITNEVLDSFNATSRRSKAVVVKSRRASIPTKRLRKTSVRESDVTSSETSSRSVLRPVRSVQPASQEKPKRALHLPKKKEKRKMPPRLAKCRKPSGSRRAHRVPPCSLDLLDSEDTCSSHGTLNDFIPPPTNFEGSNNPFLSNYQSSCNSEPISAPESPPAPRTEPISATTKPPAQQPSSVRVRPSRKCTIKNLSNSVVNNLLNDSPLDCKGMMMVSKASSSLAAQSSAADLSSSVSDFFGVADRIANGEKYSVLAKRVTPDGKVQYLVEWDGLPPS